MSDGVSGGASGWVNGGGGGACLENGLGADPHVGRPGRYLHCATGCAPYEVTDGGCGGDGGHHFSCHLSS